MTGQPTSVTGCRVHKLFRNRRFDATIMTCVRRYCRSALILRDLEDLMAERGSVDHTTIWRGTQLMPSDCTENSVERSGNHRGGRSINVRSNPGPTDVLVPRGRTVAARRRLLSIGNSVSRSRQDTPQAADGESRQLALIHPGPRWFSQRQ